jgi:5'-3' exonuclease
MINRSPPKGGNYKEPISTLLVDGNALFMNSYSPTKDMYNYKGEKIGGVFQFLTTLRKLINENLYNRVFVFWDGKFSGKLRYEIYSDYKANRNKDYINGTIPDDPEKLIQKIIIQEYLEELFVRQLEDDIVEGDDFIAYYCLSSDSNENITICTGDRDMCQLISDRVQIYFLDKKVYVNIENYKEHFKHHQKNAALIKIISGDTSDNIKGIKGVGEETLLKQFPELINEEYSIERLINKAKFIQEDRSIKKQKPLLALNNLINGVTEGIQGKDFYKINKQLVDLKNPLITKSGIEAINELISLPINPENRSMKNAYSLMKRDGIDVRVINYSEDYLLPFKKLMEREKKIFNKLEQKNNE